MDTWAASIFGSLNHAGHRRFGRHRGNQAKSSEDRGGSNSRSEHQRVRFDRNQRDDPMGTTPQQKGEGYVSREGQEVWLTRAYILGKLLKSH